MVIDVKVVLSQLKEWLELVAPFGVIFGLLWKFWLQKKFKEISDFGTKLKVIAEEFRPNGGSTLRDAINRIELKVAVQEQKTVALIKSLPLGTWVSDKYGKCIDLNHSLCRIIGRLESEIKGDNWTNWIHPDEKDDVFEEWQRCVNNMLNFDMNYRFVLPNGKIQKVHGIAYQLRDDSGNLIGFLGTLHAIADPI
jgi:PAS domain S-box-containing protein